MRTRLRRSEAALAALLVAGLLAAGGATGATEEPSGAEGWQGLPDRIAVLRRTVFR